MDISVTIPVIAGLAIGTAFVVLLSVMLKTDPMLTDEELISKYGEIAEVKYFIEKYPDAKAEVDRNSHEGYLTISFSAERQVEPPSYLYSGINSLGVTVYAKPDHLSLAISCGTSQGMTVQWVLDGINTVDEAEKGCFKTVDAET